MDSISLSGLASTSLSSFSYSFSMFGEGPIKTTPGERLREARRAAGFSTIKAAAERFGVHRQNWADHEADRRGISLENAETYAKALRVNPAWLLFGDSNVASSSSVHSVSPLRLVAVVGEVRAGAWAEVMDDHFEGEVTVSLPDYDQAQLFALRVVGRSMDKVFLEGTVLICCPAAEAGIRAGDYVIVRRHKGGLVETTVKEVVQERDGIALWPRSNDPIHQAPIRLKTAHDADEGPEIVGVVITHIPPPRRRDGPLLRL